jgi:hypothetical protein
MVEEYHVRQKIKLPNAKIHATIHTCREPDRGGRRFPGAVEGSPIDGARTGPDDAIHAIGSVVRHPSDVISGKVGGPD